MLDAPHLADDFYLNLMDWSAQNVLAVGLSSSVYLWSATTSKVTQVSKGGRKQGRGGKGGGSDRKGRDLSTLLPPASRLPLHLSTSLLPCLCTSLPHSCPASAPLYLTPALPLYLSTSLLPCLCTSIPHSCPASVPLFLTPALPLSLSLFLISYASCPRMTG